MWRRTALVLLGCALTSGCDNDWRTDMWFQASHRTQSLSLPEPAHSVALGALPPLVDIDDAEGLPNPVTADARSLAHGAELFHDRCACCHGVGHGGGPVSKFFPPAPDLAYPAIKARTDGRLFGTVSLGGRAMPPQGEGLSSRDRWDLVNYVRQIQGGTGRAP